MVAHRERLARFAFDLVAWLVERNGGEIVVLTKSHYPSPTDELFQDLLTVLSVFAGRMRGLRKYRDEIKADKTLSDSGTESDVP